MKFNEIVKMNYIYILSSSFQQFNKYVVQISLIDLLLIFMAWNSYGKVAIMIKVCSCKYYTLCYLGAGICSH